LSSELQGKTALVTGASRGIGAATATALARAGASPVVIHYGGYRDGAEAAARAAHDAGAATDIIEADLSRMEGIESFVARVREIQPEILVNNAGSLVKRCTLMDFTPELFDTVMNLNVKSCWFIAQAAAAAMIRRQSGYIVNVSSVAARNGGGPGATIYAAAKAAIAAITKGLAKELAPRGIRVNAVSPGTVDNHFHEQFSTRQMLDSIVAAIPAGSLGTNEEVADLIVFLCSQGARYIHGQTIEINGGQWMV